VGALGGGGALMGGGITGIGIAGGVVWATTRGKSQENMVKCLENAGKTLNPHNYKG